MQIIRQKIPEVFAVVPRAFADDRGVFAETYKKSVFDEAAPGIDFIQDNRSLSRKTFTIRGIHFQTPPFAQAKLVSVQRGRVLDVAVDLRRSSPTFLQHIAMELTADGGEQLFIPIGFGHAFCTLEPDTVVTYKVNAYYAPKNEGGFHWRTPELNIQWPCSAEQGLLSPKDAVMPDHIDPDACFP